MKEDGKSVWKKDNRERTVVVAKWKINEKTYHNNEKLRGNQKDVLSLETKIKEVPKIAMSNKGKGRVITSKETKIVRRLTLDIDKENQEKKIDNLKLGRHLREKNRIENTHLALRMIITSNEGSQTTASSVQMKHPVKGIINESLTISELMRILREEIKHARSMKI